jgi:hypothetical protein
MSKEGNSFPTFFQHEARVKRVGMPAVNTQVLMYMRFSLVHKEEELLVASLMSISPFVDGVTIRSRHIPTKHTNAVSAGGRGKVNHETV